MIMIYGMILDLKQNICFIECVKLLKKPHDDYFKCVKILLNHVLKHPDINISKIQKTLKKR